MGKANVEVKLTAFHLNKPANEDGKLYCGLCSGWRAQLTEGHHYDESHLSPSLHCSS